MMRNKATIGMVLVFLILLTYAILSRFTRDSKPIQNTPTPTSYPPAISDFQAEDIQLMVINDNGKKFSFERLPDASWKLTGETKKLNQGLIQELTYTIVSFRQLGELPADWQDTDLLGLDNSQKSIFIQTKDKKETMITIGGPTVTNSGYYVRINENSPIIISTYAIDAFFEVFSNGQLYESTISP